MNESTLADATEIAHRRGDSGTVDAANAVGAACDGCRVRGHRGRGARQLDGAPGVLPLHVRFGGRQRNRTARFYRRGDASKPRQTGTNRRERIGAAKLSELATDARAGLGRHHPERLIVKGLTRRVASGGRQRRLPFTNRTSRAAPSGFVLPRRTLTSTRRQRPPRRRRPRGGWSPPCAASPPLRAAPRSPRRLGCASGRPCRTRRRGCDAAGRWQGSEDGGQVHRNEGAGGPASAPCRQDRAGFVRGGPQGLRRVPAHAG